MAETEIAALLALGAAMAIGVGDVIQQRSAQDVTDEPVGHTALFLRLLRDRTWWAGSLLAGAGFVLQAAALGIGSVVLVQALLSTSLLFALPISARVNGSRISPRQGVWAVLLAVAVAVIVIEGDPSEGLARAGISVWLPVVGILGALLLSGLVAAKLLAGRPAAAVLLGLVSGALWGLFAVLTKGVVDRLDDGLWAVLAMPELYAWAVVGLLATAIQQSAFRAGSLAASLPAVNVSEPLVGSGLGILVLGEALSPGRIGWFSLVVAVAVMVAAIVALARSQSASAVGPEAV